ncbi:uncharacterized protein LOC124361735 isoform X2 [Homalodisca vitripennis]|nr:uncharacterized protein LOC124361735 isoform X2 [Homalodisca vitripennis]XP_046671647.1 uncharacterized protein LOC124361735 isoform X2 [Homalodisca vitripennis]
MEIDDIFSSPPSHGQSSKWTEKLMTKIDNCDNVINVCHCTNRMAVLTNQDGYLVVLVYLYPNISLNFILDLRKYNSKEAVVSSCAVSSLAPSLKQHFQEHLDVLDTDIVVVGLDSGLVLWFCANTPVKSPSILCNTHQRVQAVHWIKDPSGLYTHLVIVLSSGRVVVYTGQGVTNLSLPDSVHSSICVRNCLVSSNLIDCYTNELQPKKELTFNSILLPIKGVSAMTAVPGSDSSLMAVTVHGSVYCFNPTVALLETSTQFVLPDQSILDNMYTHTQELEQIYKQLNEENEITRAVSVAMAANGVPDLFQLSVKLTSENDFAVVVKIKESGFSFSREIWMSCMEIFGKDKRETSMRKLNQDFTCDCNLIINTSYSISFDEIITVELIGFLENNHPVLIVPLGQIKIDSCHLMSSQMLVSNVSRSQETLGDILCGINKEAPPNSPYSQEFKLALNIPSSVAINACLPTLLQDCQHRIPEDDWNKISGGKKYSIQVSVHGVPALLHVEPGSRMLTISCRDLQLCYQIKKSVLKRLENSEAKNISENLVLDIQALYQSFEIESLRENPDIQSLEVVRQKLRTTISSHLPI